MGILNLDMKFWVAIHSSPCVNHCGHLEQSAILCET